MNNKIKYAVAGAVMSAASVANAGIVIPAGDWTLDINGNVNAFATWSNYDGGAVGTITGSIFGAYGGLGPVDANGEDNTQGINTGLLPSWLGFTGTTRQNDVDVSFTISIQPNASDNFVTGDATVNDDSASVSRSPLARQAFLTFGDKSWGTVKVGKDLGIYASDAILNDMTLLGVGGAVGNSGNPTTTGGIGTGYIYAAWKGQIAYTTPDMNGFQATVGITNPNQVANAGDNFQDRFGIEAKASYSWTGDIAGKVWVGGASYDVTMTEAGAVDPDYTISAWDIGTSVSSGNLGLVAYYYDGKGLGTTFLGSTGYDTVNGKRRDSDGGYVQATYVIPTGTKLGVAYGTSNLDKSGSEADGTLLESNDRWTVGAYHPLTKHLNLVAEYNKIESEGQVSSNKNESDHFSLGAILFF
jgi:predicted porin